MADQVGYIEFWLAKSLAALVVIYAAGVLVTVYAAARERWWSLLAVSPVWPLALLVVAAYIARDAGGKR